MKSILLMHILAASIIAAPFFIAFAIYKRRKRVKNSQMMAEFIFIIHRIEQAEDEHALAFHEEQIFDFFESYIDTDREYAIHCWKRLWDAFDIKAHEFKNAMVLFMLVLVMGSCRAERTWKGGPCKYNKEMVGY